MNSPQRPASIVALIAVNGLIGLLGCAVALLLLIDPSGSVVQAASGWAAPFQNSVLATLALLYFAGLVPLATARGLVTNLAWSLPLTLAVGFMLFGLGVGLCFVPGVGVAPIVAAFAVSLLITALAAVPATWRYILN